MLCDIPNTTSTATQDENDRQRTRDGGAEDITDSNDEVAAAPGRPVEDTTKYDTNSTREEDDPGSDRSDADADTDADAETDGNGESDADLSTSRSPRGDGNSSPAPVRANTTNRRGRSLRRRSPDRKAKRRTMRTKFVIESLYCEVSELRRQNEALRRTWEDVRRIGEARELCRTMNLTDSDDGEVPRRAT